MELLKVGQKISIFFQKAEKLIEISCIISDLLEDRVVIELPAYFMRYIEFLEVGSPLTAKVFSKLGTIDFNTIVISSPFEDIFSVELDYNALKLTPGEEIPVIKAIENLTITMADKLINAKTFEISTEYLKFSSDYDFELNDNLTCELNLPNNCGIISFKGIISEIDPVYENEYKMMYLGMPEEARQTLLYSMYLYSSTSY